MLPVSKHHFLTFSIKPQLLHRMYLSWKWYKIFLKNITKQNFQNTKSYFGLCFNKLLVIFANIMWKTISDFQREISGAKETTFCQSIVVTKLLLYRCQYVMSGLFWNGIPLLESVGQKEPEADQLRFLIQKAMRKASVPMLAYSEQYIKYLDLMNLDINQYIQ